jgi:hypothetical protein
MSMEEFLPVKVSIYPKKGDNAKFEETVLANIVDEDDEGMGSFVIAFNIGNDRHFIQFRKIDLRNALAPETEGKV